MHIGCGLSGVLQDWLFGNVLKYRRVLVKFESRILHKETLQTPRFAGFFVVCPESFAFVASLAAGHLPPFLPAGSFPAAVRRTEGYAACRFRTVPSDGRPGICPGVRCDVSEKSLSLLKKRRICKWTVARRESSG